MKKKLCFFLIMSISITTFGQVIPKGTRFIGGDFSINYAQSKSDGKVGANNLILGISPSITRFTKDNFAVTYSLGYNLTTIGDRDYFGIGFYKVSQHNISAGLYLKNYKMFSEKFGLSVQYGGNLAYLFNTSSLSKGNAGKGAVSLSLSAGPGIIYLLNKKFALEGTASLIGLNVVYSGDSDSNVFGIGTNLSASPGISFGFRYFLK